MVTTTVTACTTRSLSTTAVKPRTEVGRSSHEQFFPAVRSVSAPAVSNSLPDNVVSSDTLATFKKRLKTHLFHCVM